jgi:hypothetical protein
LENDLRGEALLEGDGLDWRQIPEMKVAEAHSSSIECWWRRRSGV